MSAIAWQRVAQVPEPAPGPPAPSSAEGWILYWPDAVVGLRVVVSTRAGALVPTAVCTSRPAERLLRRGGAAYLLAASDVPTLWRISLETGEATALCTFARPEAAPAVRIPLGTSGLTVTVFDPGVPRDFVLLGTARIAVLLDGTLCLFREEGDRLVSERTLALPLRLSSRITPMGNVLFVEGMGAGLVVLGVAGDRVKLLAHPDVSHCVVMPAVRIVGGRVFVVGDYSESEGEFVGYEATGVEAALAAAFAPGTAAAFPDLPARTSPGS